MAWNKNYISNSLDKKFLEAHSEYPEKFSENN